jgi:EAL domain-containing protein (putative c-di-GMP-specific phosphodiesterase class I)/DNA-binding NarL/FixJ family response regulator
MAQNILLIQDDPTLAGTLREALESPGEESFHVEWVRRCAEGIERLAEDGRSAPNATDRIAAVLVDLLLPDSHSVAAFDELLTAAPGIPILVLSTPEDECVAKLAVQHGAQDYLLKSRLDSHLLPKILRNLLEHAASAEALFHEKARVHAALNAMSDFPDAPLVDALDRKHLERGLRAAMHRRDFVLHYQPKMNLRTGAIVGVEALIRWRHSQLGLVAAAQFIPTAAECGCIVSMGRWVLREACGQAQAWQDAGLPAVPVAVNLCADELRAKDVVAGLREILADTGLAPQCLELELNQLHLLRDLNSTVPVLCSLKDLGVQLALDVDTACCSFNHLQRLPIDSLKIDRSLVSTLGGGTHDASVLAAIVSLGESLRMRVVAEGVETRQQLAQLQEQSCPMGQGFYFSPAVAAEAFGRMLRRDVAQLRDQCDQPRGLAATP